MNRLALLFAGQGSQYAGMGIDIIDAFPYGKSLVDLATQELGIPLPSLLTNDSGLLNETRWTQPAIFVTSAILFETLKSQVPFTFHGTTGFSLGEYNALYASGVFTYLDSLKLIKTRAEAMAMASQINPGKMSAVLGLSYENLMTVVRDCQKDGDAVSIANINCPGQNVLSGTEEALNRCGQKALDFGAKRVIPIQVSGAFHSPLMNPAVPLLSMVLKNTPRQIPQVPTYMNVTASPLNIENIDTLLCEQIVQPVRFLEIMVAMQKAGYTHFLEIGPGTVLSGFLRKTLPEATIEHCGTLEDITRVKGWLENHGFTQ